MVGSRQPGRAGADDQDIDFENFTLFRHKEKGYQKW